MGSLQPHSGDHRRCRALLEALLRQAVADGSRADPAAVRRSDPELISALVPVAEAGGSISWLAANGERVDATLRAGDQEWRVVFGSRDRSTVDWLHVHTKPALFEGVDGGQAVVINGASGAGKSTLMQAIQARAGGPWVVFDEPEQLGTVPPEYLIWREQAPTLHHGYLAAIASLARAGNYVTVPAGHAQAELADHLAGIPTLWVGLYCDRSVLIERERRSGRWGGISDNALDIHRGWTYDLTFDTTTSPDPTSHAQQILHEAATRRQGRTAKVRGS